MHVVWKMKRMWKYFVVILFPVSNILTGIIVSYHSYSHAAIAKCFKGLPPAIHRQPGALVMDVAHRGFTMDDQMDVDTLPFIYIITPTHARYTQKVDLTSLCHTLMHVPNVIWIVVEDSEFKTEVVLKLLQVYFHLSHCNL